MSEFVNPTYIGALLFVIALILIGAWMLKGIMANTGGGGGGLLRGKERRLGVVAAASVDGRRRLILLRRDDKEHLIMTGGPVDMLIEAGIEPPREDTSDRQDAPSDDTVSAAPQATTNQGTSSNDDS